MDTCYDVLPNCKNHYFPARSKDLKRWCCIRIVDEHEDVNGVEKKKNSHIALTTSPLTSTTKKHKKTKSKKSDGTREKNKKKAKKSEKSSKSKTSKLKEKDKHLMPTITSGSRWTTILTEITKHDRTVSPKHDNIKHMSTTKDNLIPTTPSYFSLPKHTHISDHHKEESSSNIRAVSSGKTTSVTIMKVPMTTRFQSNSTQTTKSSTTLTPSTQSVSSTVSSLNQDVNTTTINLSVISKSRFKMTTPEKTEQPISSSIHTESDYKRTSLNPKTTLSLVEEEIEVTESKRPLTATSTLSPTTKEVTLIEGSSESNTDETPTISVTTNEPTTKSIYSIKSSSKLISSLSRIATTPTTSSRPSTTTNTLPATISVISPSEVTLVPKPSSSSAQSDNIASTIKSASFKETLKTTISIISPPEVTLVPKPSLSVDQSVNIASTIESLSTASFTTIKPTSLFTFSAAKEDLKSEDVTANKPTNSIKTIKDSTIDTTIKSTPITLRTFTFSTERMNSTIVNLMESSMLNKETTLPTESLPPKELKSRQSTQSLVPSTIVATKLKVQKSTRAPRTTTIEILDVSTDENGESNEEPVIEEEKKEKKDSLIHALLFNGSQRKKPRKLLRAQLGLKVLGR
ncbi:unnamed protein product [Diamesa serratosioi]